MGLNPVVEYRTDCEETAIRYGEKWEQTTAIALQWFALITSLLILMWYIKQTANKKCGWEEFYVCFVETIKVILEMNFQYVSPALIIQFNGVVAPWLRFSEWLLTCPVILIHLSNITGLEDDYSKRTMRLLVSDIGTIVMGVTSAFSKGYLKAIFFMLGLAYGSSTFFSAAKAFMEAFHKVPKGGCRMLVKVMAIVFFGSWVWYPIVFMLGPEGFGHLTIAGADIAMTFVDMHSKNAFGFIGHFLRLKIKAYVLEHGDLRKKKKINVGGQEVEVNCFDDDEGPPENDKLEEIDDGDDAPPDRAGDAAHRGTVAMGNKGDPLPQEGRVLLGVPDNSLVQIINQTFHSLPVRVDLLTAVGPESILHTAQFAIMSGGLDFVLLHPALLDDYSFVNRIRGELGLPVCAFGWMPYGPERQKIESAPIDGFLAGPGIGMAIDARQLMTLISGMQQKKKMGAMISTGGDGFTPNPIYNQGSGMPLLGQSAANMGTMPGSGTITPNTFQQQQPDAQVQEQKVIQDLLGEIKRLKSELQ